jgi:hypothetical protein
MAKENNGSVYRTMQGKHIDMVQLINQNELTVAVGNAKVNARGDELGPGGRIIKKREDVLREASSSRVIPDQLNILAVELPEVEVTKVAEKKVNKGTE